MEPNYGYKHTKGFLVFILLVIIMAIGAVYAQTSPNTPSGYSIDNQTGNLIPNGAITSVSGWAVTTGSPTWTPVSPGGSFSADGYTFSYGVESLGRSPSVSLSSFNHGYLNSNAVFVTGFSYGLTYRFPCANSIGTNCDGTAQAGYTSNPTQDNLRVEVGYYPATGSPTFYTHQLGLKNINDGNSPYNPTWQTLAETVTFAGAKPLSQAGSVNYEIIGRDVGGWACLGADCYGPQVKNAYIRANYSVDPCILNPAFNPNCPGFNNVIQGVQSPVYWHSYNIAQRLPHIGGGVQLHGFEYGFNWSNYGSCYNTFLFWCTDWRTDGGGTVNFRVTDKTNTALYTDSQYRQGNNQSGGYYNRFLFTETKNSLDMGNVEWWVSGGWNNFAVAGWTRPIWTPDPCYFNGLYSPNCTNFQATLKQVLADVQAQQERIAALNTPTTSAAPASLSTPTNNITAASTTPTSNTINVLETASTQTKSDTTSASPGTQFALSLVQSNQRREQNIALQASAMARAEATARAEAAQQESISVAASNQQQGASSSDAAAQAAVVTLVPTTNNRTNSMSNQTAPGSSVTTTNLISTGPTTANSARSSATSSEVILPEQPNNSNTINVVKMPDPQPMSSQQTLLVTPSSVPYLMPNTQSDLALVDNRSSMISMVRPNMVSAESPVIPSAVVIEPAAVIQTPQQASVEVKNSDTDPATSPTNFVTNRTNPITSIVEGRPPTVESGAPKTELAAVNKSVAPNELAVGMDIDRIAVTPQGFNVYASLVLRDAAFYAPREIYRGQRTVDNVRALRSLAQDARHQEMVDQQYGR